MYDNAPEETRYIYTDFDAENERLNGRNAYSVTFAKGELPPVNGFWSLTLYNKEHLFEPNKPNRFSLGTKSKSLKYNEDGSLTLYFQNAARDRPRKATGCRRQRTCSRSTFEPTGQSRQCWTGHGCRRRSSEHENDFSDQRQQRSASCAEAHQRFQERRPTEITGLRFLSIQGVGSRNRRRVPTAIRN